MKQFLETICILDGVAQHPEWHQRRIDDTLHYFYPGHQHSWSLVDSIDIPPELCVGAVRCRIIYDAHLFSIQYSSYESRPVQTLKLINALPGFDYRYKYADRVGLDELFAQREEADDILIMRNGWITDTSVANIAFQKNDIWYTPSIPLLAGTTWKRLVSSGILITSPVHWTQLTIYDSFKVFNSMNDWKACVELPINYISMMKA